MALIPPYDSRLTDGIGTPRYHGSYFGFDRLELPSFIDFCKQRGLADEADHMQRALDNDKFDFQRMEFGFSSLDNPIWSAFDEYVASRPPNAM